MICKQCGNQLDDNAKFCTRCGCRVELERRTAIDRQNVPQGSPLKTSSRIRKARAKARVFIAVLAAALVLGVVAVTASILEKQTQKRMEAALEEFAAADHLPASSEESTPAETSEAPKSETSEPAESLPAGTGEESSAPTEEVKIPEQPIYQGEDLLPLSGSKAALCEEIIEQELEDAEEVISRYDPAYEVDKHLVYAALMDYNGDGSLDLLLNLMYSLDYEAEDPTEVADTTNAYYMANHPGEDVGGRVEIWNLSGQGALIDSFEYFLPFENQDGYGDQPGLFLEVSGGRIQITEYHFYHQENGPTRSLEVFYFDNNERQDVLTASILSEGDGEFSGHISDFESGASSDYPAGTVNYVDDNYFSPIQADGQNGPIDLFAKFDQRIQNGDYIILFWGKHASFRCTENDTEAFRETLRGLAGQGGSAAGSSEEPAGSDFDDSQRAEEILNMVREDDEEENERGWKRIGKTIRYIQLLPSQTSEDYHYLLCLYTYQAQAEDPKFLFWYEEYQGKDAGLCMEIWNLASEEDEPVFSRDCGFMPLYTDFFEIPYFYLGVQDEVPVLYSIARSYNLSDNLIIINEYRLDDEIESDREVWIGYGYDSPKSREGDPIYLTGGVWDSEEGTILEYSSEEGTALELDVREEDHYDEPGFGDTIESLITIPFENSEDPLLEAFAEELRTIRDEAELLFHGGWYGQFDPFYREGDPAAALK